ncbi:MAG: DUF2155 domain-containing protein [Acetobacteraceae bacterium]|nr:DUF2155 domain-containing protein [Acetobacteraceae bacterium]
MRAPIAFAGTLGLLIAFPPKSFAEPAPPDPAAPSEQAPPAPPWVPRSTAELQGLDKVNARRTTLEVKVGTSAQYGSLKITVQSCEVRPPDQPQDAAAFLIIADSHESEPGFRGWMFASAPSVSMLEHPIYDVRLTGCRS